MMYSKRRKLPLEVSSWMEKDITLRKASANSRMLTNETRQNIVLSRQFFSDLLNLSFARYQKMAEYDFEKRMFLKNQQKKSKTAMPGVQPYVNQLNYSMRRAATSRIQSNSHNERLLLSSSSLSRPSTKPDPTYYRRQESSIGQIRTAQIKRSQLEVLPTPTTTRQMSRERLNRLAQPKSYHFKSALGDHVRLNISKGAETVEEMIAKIDQTSQVTPSATHDTSLEKPKTAVDDKRFHHLMDSFSHVDATKRSHLQTVQSIVQGNSSLQDDEGQWKIEHASISARKAELIHQRQMRAENFRRRVDVFLINIPA